MNSLRPYSTSKYLPNLLVDEVGLTKSKSPVPAQPFSWISKISDIQNLDNYTNSSTAM
jgi:hypothetical protein